MGISGARMDNGSTENILYESIKETYGLLDQMHRNTHI
jgi:hypothetical protein